MYVIKRNGAKAPVMAHRVMARIAKLCRGLSIDPMPVAQEVIDNLANGIKTTELDHLAAETAVSYISKHKDFGILAARVCVSNLHKNTEKTKRFSDVATILRNYVHPKTKKPAPLLRDDVYAFIQENAAEIDAKICFDRDYNLDYFGLKTMQRSYLLKVNGEIIERPQHMFMRVACALWCGHLDEALHLYDLLSEGYVMFGSPTLFHAGLPISQLSSCFLHTIQEDSIAGIYKTLGDCAAVSKQGGGQSVVATPIRAKDSYISTTNGTSNGLVPMLKVFGATAAYVDQGGGKRAGSSAIYLEPWHADILAFLDMRKQTGAEEERCRNLFTALWTCNEFMRRVVKNETWSLFCPNEAPGLGDVWGEEFENLYRSYEARPELIRKQLSARELFTAICASLTETGTPYMLKKDACNFTSNQRHRGTIKVPRKKNSNRTRSEHTHPHTPTLRENTPRSANTHTAPRNTYVLL